MNKQPALSEAPGPDRNWASVRLVAKIARVLCSYTKENGMKKLSLLMLVALFLTTSVLGCNTMKGAGKDVENAGESIQRTVDHND